jgi:hypothetical protein
MKAKPVKINVPKKEPVACGLVRINPEAMAIIQKIQDETQMYGSQIVSQIIIQAAEYIEIEWEKEES